MLELQAASNARAAGPLDAPRAGWGQAKSIIMVYLQGGPSHLDLWDPKDNVPDNVRSIFKPIDTKVPGTRVTEILAQTICIRTIATHRVPRGSGSVSGALCKRNRRHTGERTMDMY